MAANIELIAKIVQKNGGTFKLLDAVNIDWTGFSFADLGSDQLAAMKVYTMEQTETKIAEAIAAAPHLQRKAVDALPEVADASENIIYMVKREKSVESTDGIDAYDEYMLIDGAFEHIGSTVVDLTDYIKTADAEAKIAAALAEAKTAASTAEQNAKAYADGLATTLATAAQGAKADTALQQADIAEGTTQGAIEVKGQAVNVHGLGTAAYENMTTIQNNIDAAKQAAVSDANAYTDEKIGDVDLSGIANNAEAIEQLQKDLKTTDDKAVKNAADIATANTAIGENKVAIATLNGDSTVDGSVDQKVAAAKSELQDQINQLGEISGGNITSITADVAANKAAIEKLNGTGDGSVSKAVSDAKEELQGNIDNVESKADAAQAAADAAQAAADKNAEDIAALEPRVKANEDAIATLNGDANTAGSVAKQVADAVAGIIDGAPDAYNTLKEISDWIAAHPESVAELNSLITANSTAIDNLKKLVGTLPEGETDVVSYIDKVVAAAEATAAADATNKANAAQAAAEATAAADATSKANAAQAAAEATAAADATSKANAAEQNAKDYADSLAANYATAEQGAKADTALQGIAGVAATVTNNVATITGVSTDLLTQGTNVLVLNGGSAF